MSKSKPIPALLSDLNAMLLMTGCDYSDVLLIDAQDLTRQAATITVLRERHEAFVRKVQDAAVDINGWNYNGQRRELLSFCDAELDKEN